MRIIQVVLVSATPLIEARGGIPLAILLGLSKTEAIFFGILGNTLGLFLAFAVLDYMQPFIRKITLLQRIYSYSTLRVRRKEEVYRKLRYWALFTFVALPLPGTGAWTAALITYLLGFERKRALAAIFLGIVAMSILIMGVGVITFRGVQRIF
ncbi:MAG TPA: small multi-drug export protein [Firmicutes bacterium]|nr:small multi-drug export protein [Bacillota bacterium]